MVKVIYLNYFNLKMYNKINVTRNETVKNV